MDSPSVQAILAILADAPKPMRRRELAAATGYTLRTTSVALSFLKRQGILTVRLDLSEGNHRRFSLKSKEPTR